MTAFLPVAIASGGAVAAVYAMLHQLERNIDRRLDKVELAIRDEAQAVNGLQRRISRLEDHENQEAQNIQAVILQMQQWLEAVRSPIALKLD